MAAARFLAYLRRTTRSAFARAPRRISQKRFFLPRIRTEAGRRPSFQFQFQCILLNKGYRNEQTIVDRLHIHNRNAYQVHNSLPLYLTSLKPDAFKKNLRVHLKKDSTALIE